MSFHFWIFANKKVPQNLYIKAFESVSSLGNSSTQIWNSYLEGKPKFSQKEIKNTSLWVSQLDQTSKKQIQALKKESKVYKNLDNSVLMLIYLAKKLKKNKHLNFLNTGVNLGSSRGATETLESAYKEFFTTGQVPSLTSPTTTLGNLSSWVAQELLSEGPTISHSITCSTALHALLNANAWLQAGLAKSFVIGGSEAPLTDFTIAQMKALKLYSSETSKWACRSLDLKKTSNTLVLAEASNLFVIEQEPENAIAQIKGLGYATEKIAHNISISKDALCFQKSMKMALQDAHLESVDAIVLHAPGTVRGDFAELEAIQKVFYKSPFLTTNKFMMGHSFGASGGMSLEMAILMLMHQKVIENPFYTHQNIPQKLDHIMVNAVGFGGNACSVIVGI